MSDLIHEGPKDPNKPPVPGEEKPTTERERMKKVYTYVAILFTVAFLLILWTFLMNQRSINEIKDGNTALQSTLQQNDSLEAHIAELEEQLATAEEDKKALDETVGLQSNQLCAHAHGGNDQAAHHKQGIRSDLAQNTGQGGLALLRGQPVFCFCTHFCASPFLNWLS